jgi:serine/threonine protein phosphatase PrpC
MKTVNFFGRTDLGCIRTNNEDAFLVCNIWDDEHILAVVIDGVGGYEGGEVAAALAQESILEFLKMNTEGDCLQLIKEAVISANNRIFSEREQNRALSNMSCVLTASLIEVDSMRVNIAHVGDTRIYQFASSQMEKLSHDHSLVGYREEIGDLTEEEAMTHPQRNIISRDVGSCLLTFSDNNYVEVASYPLENNTQLLLCSDGLCDMITSKKMAAVISEDISVEEKVNSLIDEALKAGGRDNVTVVLVEVCSDEEEKEEDVVPVVIETTEMERPEPRKKNLIPLLLLLVLLVAVCVWILSSPGSDKNGAEKISADTTLVESADTISANDSWLTSSVNSEDADVQ